MPNLGPTVECVLCPRRFTVEDILAYKFFIETLVCYRCYRRMYRLPADVSCFGKKHKRNKPGFKPTAKECRVLCPDRKICPLFMTKEIKSMISLVQELDETARKGALALLKKADTKERSRKHPFRPGTVVYKAFELCRKGISKQEFEKWCHKQRCSRYRLLRVFRSEEIYGKKWTWKESQDRYSIKYS